MPYKIPSVDRSTLDPDGGLLCLCTYWRPRLTDPDPEMPGEKQQAISFMQLLDNDLCLCGSGKHFQLCCKVKPYWQVICPNPGLQGYDCLAPQEVPFTDVNGNDLGSKLMDDERLYCVENTRKRAFWTYWGDPGLLAPLGTLCFGDFELLNAQTLIVSAMSNRRMEILLALLHELVSDSLGKVQIKYDKIEQIKKFGLKKRTGSKGRH